MRRSIVALVLALTFLVGGTPPPSSAQSQTPLRILSRDGSRTLPVVMVNNQEYVALDDMATAFGLTLREDRLAGGVTATAGSRSVIISADQPVVSVAGRLVSLSAAPVRQGNRWLLPLDFLQRALGPTLDTRMELRRAARLLVVGDMRVPRVAARVESTASGATVTFDIQPPAPARVTLEGGRLGVTVDADALDFSPPQVPPQEFLQAVQQGDTPTTIRLVAGPKFAVHRATSTQPDASSARLVVELLPAGTDAPAPTVVAPSPAPTPADIPPMPSPVAPGVRTIVIDAGHGGDDHGARGASGTLEKDVTLSVARRLRTMVESRLGLRVFMTRDDDRTMSLDERAAYANIVRKSTVTSSRDSSREISVMVYSRGNAMFTQAPANDPLLFGLSLVFLFGVLLSAASVFPAFRERFPRLLLYGFGLAVGAIVLVLVVGLLRA